VIDVPAFLRGVDSNADAVAPRRWIWRRSLVTAAVVAVIPFALALAVTLVYDLAGAYLRSELLYLGLFGVFWSAFWYLWSVGNIVRMVEASRVAFAVPDEQLDRFERKWLARYRAFPVGLVVAVGGGVAFYIVWSSHRKHELRVLPDFGAEWLTGPDLVAKNVVLVTWAFTAMAVLVPNLLGAAWYTGMIHELSMRSTAPQLVPSIPAARDGLRRIAIFGLVTGIAWTFAAGVTVLVLSADVVRWQEIVLVSFLEIFGFALIVWPPLALQAALARVRDQRTYTLAHRINELHREPRPTGTTEEVEDLERRLGALGQESTWVYPSTFLGTTAVASQLLLPAAALAVTVLTGGG